jgi:hypothetical protein
VRPASDDITFTAARTVTLRDEYMLAACGLTDTREALPAAVALIFRWADPPVTLDRIWEIPSHEIQATMARLYGAINESRRVTTMLAEALADAPPTPIEEATPS